MGYTEEFRNLKQTFATEFKELVERETEDLIKQAEDMRKRIIEVHDRICPEAEHRDDCVGIFVSVVELGIDMALKRRE